VRRLGGKPAKEGALKSKEKKSDFRSSFFDYAIHSSFLRTCNRAPTPSVARGHALIINKNNYLIINKIVLIASLLICSCKIDSLF